MSSGRGSSGTCRGPRRSLAPLGTGGNLTSDAHLAALAIEHGATVCSTDWDFARFAGVELINPLRG